MTFTYNSASITTDLAKTRLYLGDTNSSSLVFTDEELNALLAAWGTPLEAAAAAADAAAAKYSRSVAFSVEGLSIQNSQKAENYRKLAASLRAASASGGGGVLVAPVLTGVSIADMEAAQDDTDRPQDSFGIGMHDDVGARRGNPE